MIERASGGIAAVVLCGGSSRRMGRPKDGLPFGPEPLLRRVARQLAAVTGSVLVVAAPGQDIPDLPDVVGLVRDPIGGQGPLRGLATGLEGLPAGAERVFVTAVDYPFLAPGWVEELARRIGGADVVVPWIGGRAHPLSALYRRSTALPAARRLLDSGERRLLALLDELRTISIEDKELRGLDPTLRSVINVNTPDEYRSALVIGGFEGTPKDVL